MQEVYLLVFCCRYVDLLYSYISLYNSCMKILLITCTALIVHTMRFKRPICDTYDKNHDTFNYPLYLIVPCLVMGVIFCEEYSLLDIMWTFSIFLEAVAIIPQLVILQKYRDIENLTSKFVICMGLYRFFYILNWILRYMDNGYVNWIGWSGGLVQTLLYGDFFYYYTKSRMHGSAFTLPTDLSMKNQEMEMTIPRKISETRRYTVW